MKDKIKKTTGCCNRTNFHDAHGTTKVICLNQACDNYLGYTNTKRSIFVFRWSLSFGILALIIAFSLNDLTHKSEIKEFEKSMMVPFENFEPAKLDPQNLKNEIEQQDILCGDVVYAQMMLESGNLKSFLLKKTNNMLGMRFPFQRETKAVGIYLPAQDTIILGTQDELRRYGKLNNYAVYDSWQDAVEDYKLWQSYSFKMNEHYMEFLGKVYAEDDNYISKLRKVAASNS